MYSEEDKKIMKENKRYLETYQDLKLDFIREKDDAAFWKAVSYNVGASKLDESGVPKTSHSNFKPIDKYLEISERCEERADEIDKKKLEIVEAVNQVEKRYERMVLKLHYIDDYGFHDIADKLTFHIEHIYRLHKQGLLHFVIPIK